MNFKRKKKSPLLAIFVEEQEYAQCYNKTTFAMTSGVMDISQSLDLLTLQDADTVVKADSNIIGPWAKVQSTKEIYSVGDFIKLKQVGRGTFVFRVKTIERRRTDNFDTITISTTSFSLFNFSHSSRFMVSIATAMIPVCPKNFDIFCKSLTFDSKAVAAQIKTHSLYLNNTIISDNMSIYCPDNLIDLVMISEGCKISFVCVSPKDEEQRNISYPQGLFWVINASLIESSKMLSQIPDRDCVVLSTSCTNIFDIVHEIKNSLEQNRSMVIFDDVGAHKDDCIARIIHKYSFTIKNAWEPSEVTPTKDTSFKNDSWTKIGGYSEIINSIRGHVKSLEFFENSLSRKIGISAPKGILLYGPPGCSKSMIARAIASSSNIEFISLKGPEIFSKWVGDSEKAISEIFRKARKLAPCVVFFDEFDSLGSSRSLDVSSGVESRVVSQLLSEIDGLSGLSKVLVVAATNRPDVLDPALLRPGRLDLHFYVPLPDAISREAIIKLQLLDTCLAERNELVDKLVSLSAGCSGAEIVSGCKSLIVAQIKGQDILSDVQRSLFKQ